MPTQDPVQTIAQAAIFQVITVEDGAEGLVGDLLPDIGALTRAVGFRDPQAGLTCVVGIGAHLWDRLYGAGTRPAHLRPFAEIRGERHVAVATPGDLLLHIRGMRQDMCFELSRQIMRRLAGRVAVADEVTGFRYFDSRDILGFVDGTENPEGDDAYAAALIGPEDARYAGGSYVIVQKYVHDLDAWEALPTAEQERVIGRTKLEDIELADDVKPADSHVALNDISDADGNGLDIVRDNMTFGSVAAGEYGTYFIGYAKDPGTIEQMLRNMFLGDPPGTTDRILDFSTARTGSLYFVPSAAFLDDPAPAAPDAAPAAPTDDAPPADGSLGIGRLR